MTYWELEVQSPPSWQFPARWKRSIGTFPETLADPCCGARRCHLGGPSSRRGGQSLHRLSSICICRGTMYSRFPSGDEIFRMFCLLFVLHSKRLFHLLRWRVAPGLTPDSNCVVKGKGHNGARCVSYYGWRLLHCNVKGHKSVKCYH